MNPHNPNHPYHPYHHTIYPHPYAYQHLSNSHHPSMNLHQPTTPNPYPDSRFVPPLSTIPTHNNPRTTQTLASTAEKKVLEELATHVEAESRKTVYAVGGSIPIATFRAGSGDDTNGPPRDSPEAGRAKAARRGSLTAGERKSEEMRCEPVTIRWDATSGEHGDAGADVITQPVRKVTLPVIEAEEPSFQQLLKDCQPASFGRGSENVLDESYRKAGKMDESVFCSNFNPYALGIVETAARTLAPALCARNNTTGGIRAELYKLNVYSAPSGKFKAHVDTPRSKDQIGSLVICLPSVHERGQLIVRHEDIEAVFDWSGDQGRNLIQWAAFYSDCEHEVLEVTQGHRLTLTYNLFVTSPINIAGIDSTRHGLYQILKKLLAMPAFCQGGATIGYHCAHAYPHTEKETIEALPATLKGVDRLIYECFQALAGPNVSLRTKFDIDIDEESVEQLSSEALRHDSPTWAVVRDMIPNNVQQEWASRQYGPSFEAWTQRGWEGTGMEDLAILAEKLQPLKISDYCEDESRDWAEIFQLWNSSYAFKRVHWLNKAKHKQAALFHAAYGNEPSTDTKYSNLVVILEVAPFHERRG